MVAGSNHALISLTWSGLTHSSCTGDDDIMPLATVASLRQHPLMSSISCWQWDQENIIVSQADKLVVLENGASSWLARLLTYKRLKLERTQGKLCSRTLFFPPATILHEIEWIPPCSFSCSTWWSRTNWCAAGCTTGEREPSLAIELRRLCCDQGVCACVRVWPGQKSCSLKALEIDSPANQLIMKQQMEGPSLCCCIFQNKNIKQQWPGVRFQSALLDLFVVLVSGKKRRKHRFIWYLKLLMPLGWSLYALPLTLKEVNKRQLPYQYENYM